LDAHRVANVKARRRDNKLASSGPSLPLCRQREKCKAQDSFARRRPSLVAGVYRLARKAHERCEVEGKRQIDDAELAARPQRRN